MPQYILVKTYDINTHQNETERPIEDKSNKVSAAVAGTSKYYQQTEVIKEIIRDKADSNVNEAPE